MVLKCMIYHFKGVHMLDLLKNHSLNTGKIMLILIDQDGVLADFEQGVREHWQNKFTKPLPILPSERKHFYLAHDLPQYRDELYEIYSSKGFFANLPPISGAINALHELLNAGHDVRICTAPISAYQNCVAEKFMWVEKHLGKDWTNRIILTKDKTWVRGDILIDDKPDITGSLTPMWTHWVYDQPYNRHLTDKTRISWENKEGWQQLLIS